ncbi:MAG: threonylcarbamoyl-AMP synthase [Candidatus Riflebacteria bacterium]|nr:threonylcarbamoyl-AMP synthase [Candidatus Riflebacteria bacterium]
MIIRIHPVNPEARLIARVVSVLEGGGVIAYPTDSVYALGCNAKNNRAVERLYKIKKSDRLKPFSLICSEISEISEYAKVSNQAFRILKHHLPGPYVFILEASRRVPKLLTDRRKTIGVRIPSNPVARMLAQGLGGPMLSSSCKTEDGEFMVDPEEIDRIYGPQISAVIHAEEVGQEPSSVISLVDDEVAIVRQGKGDLSFFS